MPTANAITRALSAAIAAGPMESAAIEDAAANLLGRRWRWIVGLSQRLSEQYTNRPRPRQEELIAFLRNDALFRRACRRNRLRIVKMVPPRASMCPIGAAESWSCPAICSAGELADFLGVSIPELDWFADRRGVLGKLGSGRLSHYHYRILSKRFGQVRLIESPKPRLKAMQRRVLAELLDCVPPHRSAHGFCRQRSIRSFAAPHVDKQVVMRIDLRDFFPSIAAARVAALFRSLGYPESVANLLTGLCTTSAPMDVWRAGDETIVGNDHRAARWRYARRHLPQGAPTSPAIANLCAYRLDCRLSALAAMAGATYTRYADDLAFSGDEAFARSVGRFSTYASATIMEEGFAVHFRKTRIMRKATRQRLAGLIVNQRLNIDRRDFDRLKAILNNCLRHGGESQNREGHPDFAGHLLGKISFVEMIHPARGQRLREMYNQIRW